MSKRAKTSAIVAIVLLGFTLAVLYHYYASVYEGRGYPYNTFLFDPRDRFNDFFRTVYFNRELNPYLGEQRFMQFPALNLVGFAFSLIPANYALLTFILIVTGSLMAACWYSLRIPDQSTNWLNVFVLSFLTLPFLYDIDRGNLDGIIFAAVTLWFLLYLKKSFVISVLPLSAAIAMKPFTAVFLLVYISDRRFREAVLALGVAGALSLLTLLAFRGGFLPNLRAALLVPGLPDVNKDSGYFSANNFSFHCVSLFAILKVYLIESHLIERVDMTAFSRWYVFAVLAACIPISVYVIIVEKEFWRKVSVLSVAMVVFPQLSADYRLLYMFVPVFGFLLAPSRTRADPFYAILFGLLLIPKSYYILPTVVTDSSYHDFTLSDPINVLIMLVILGACVLAGILAWRRATNEPAMEDLEHNERISGEVAGEGHS